MGLEVIRAGSPGPMRRRGAPLSRRDFIRGAGALIGGFVGALIAAPGIAFLLSPALEAPGAASWIDLGPLDSYEIGRPTLREFTRTAINGWERTAVAYGAFVLRLDPTTVRVFSNICTHLGCHVNWHAELQHYISPCHDGHFNILGKNISGPPPRPLDEFVTRVEAGSLRVQLPPLRRAA